MKLTTLTIMMVILMGTTFAESSEEEFKPPNIVIIMADDMGIDDVSFHGQKQHITPNIDSIASHGMNLNHLYTPPMCTPSRSAFMTGKYPFHTGTQHYVISNEEPWGLPLNYTTIAEVFKAAGYSTHLIGKWHLGFAKKEYLPTNRGFDTHFGYLGGFVDYYSRMALMPIPNASIGYDFRRNLDLNCESKGTYLTDLFTTEAESLIDSHDAEKPLFLMVNHLAPHTANQYDPFQAPEEDIEKFSYIKDKKRRVYAAMISKLDDSVGNIIKALDEKQILNNTILAFYSDNGAPSLGFLANGGSNFPFRGQKNTPWEGAVRVAGAIWSPLLRTRQTVFNQKMSVVDFLPTLAKAADIDLDPELELDGIDLWDELSSGNTEPFDRDMVHVLDDIFGMVAINKEGFKYINGTTLNGKFDSVLIPRQEEQDPRDINYAGTVLNSTTSQILSKYDTIPLTKSTVNELRSLGEIKCANPKNKVNCRPLKEECLYKINEDPCEEINLAKLPEYESVLNDMRAALSEYRSTAVQPANKPSCEDGDPSAHNCTWTWFTQLPVQRPLLKCINRIITC